jgi:hypothetical protein
MVETRSVIGVANVHAGAFAHRVEPFQDLDRLGAIFGSLRFACHAKHIAMGSQEPKQNTRAGTLLEGFVSSLDGLSGIGTAGPAFTISKRGARL